MMSATTAEMEERNMAPMSSSSISSAKVSYLTQGFLNVYPNIFMGGTLIRLLRECNPWVGYALRQTLTISSGW